MMAIKCDENTSPNFRCACKSLKQLKRWFTRREYGTLLKHGYKAYMVEVTAIVAESETQVLFSFDEPYVARCREIRLY